MRDNLHRRLSLSEFANAVNLSVWRLCHIFKCETGISPIQYLRLLRLERARYLLQTSLLSVGGIARNVGLHDESHFVRDFKKTYGAAPSLYRERQSAQQVRPTNSKKSQRKMS
jgi:AraC family transcriptional regulator